MKNALLGAADMLLLLSLALNCFLIGKASQCVIMPTSIEPIDLK